MTNGNKVKKRNGSIEPLNLEKIHVMVEEACKGLAGVSASQVEIQSGIQFYDGITTGEIQEILIKSAKRSELPSLLLLAKLFCFVKGQIEVFGRALFEEIKAALPLLVSISWTPACLVSICKRIL